MHWESALERDAFTLLDLDNRVLRCREQPAQLHYDDGHTAFTHYPDLLIESEQRLYFTEIKSDSEAQTEEVQHRTALLASPLADLGFGYHLLLESDIRQQPHLNNARLVRRYGYTAPDTHLSARLMQRVENGALTWAELADDADLLAAACHLILKGRLAVSWHETITASTLITKVRTN